VLRTQDLEGRLVLASVRSFRLHEGGSTAERSTLSKPLSYREADGGRREGKNTYPWQLLTSVLHDQQPGIALNDVH
jgi:hypothetical protein